MSLHTTFIAILLVSALLSSAVYVLGCKALAAGKQFPRFRLSPRILDSFFLVVVFSFFVLFALLDIRRFESFNYYGFDFAVFDQTVWNSLHGRLFENTIVPDAPILLSQRFSPILLALVPLYALNDPRLYVILPALGVAASAFPLYWFARNQLGRALALLVVVAFFLTPAVHYMGLGQFYETLLAMPLLMLASVFLLRRRYGPFLVCLGLTLLCKEEMAFIAVGLGLFAAIVQRKPKLGLGLAFASLVLGVVLLEIVIPFFGGGSGYYYFGGSSYYGHVNYGYLGNSLAEIVPTLITQPGLALQHILVPGKAVTLVRLFMPLGLLALVGGEVTVLSLPTLGYTFLSDVEGQYVLSSHHYAPVIPFLSLGAVVGIRRILDWRARNAGSTARIGFKADRIPRTIAVGVFILTTSVPTYLVDAPGPYGGNFEPNRYALTEHAAIGDALVRMIPKDASVLTEQELVTHVSERRDVYIMPAIPCLARIDYLFVDATRPWYGYHRSAWEDALARDYFETVVERDGYILKKFAPIARVENSTNARFGNALTLLGYTLPLSGTVAGGQRLNPWFTWRVEGHVPEGYVVRIRLVDAQDHLWSQYDPEPCRGLVPQDQRSSDQVFTYDASLLLPVTMPAGVYKLTIAVLDEKTDQFLPAYDSDGRTRGAQLEVMSLPIRKNKGSYTASQLYLERPLYVDMQEMRFLGFVPPREKISSGELVQVGLYWRARSKPMGDYQVVVQLRDANGRVAFEQAARPANDTYPTTEWDAGEVLLDWHDFVLPQDITAGAYEIVVSLRDLFSQRTLGTVDLPTVSVER